MLAHKYSHTHTRLELQYAANFTIGLNVDESKKLTLGR